MHNDEPTLEDILGRGPLVKEVGEAIACCTPPQVFGIHGDWGLGKTSFLHQVQWYLTGDCPQQPEAVTKAASALRQKNDAHKKAVRTVWFDAWRYQNEEAPIVALLHEMRAQFSWQSPVGGWISREAEVLFRGTLLSLEDVTKKIGFQYSKFRQANREWESENLAATLPSHTLREHLQEAIKQLLSISKDEDDAPPTRLVIFIDDVDRCEPEAAYHLLEGLKIYLNLDNCVFVIGMNQKATEEAIGKRMRTESGDDTTKRAAAYMEKLCQNVWRLPAVLKPGQVLYDLLPPMVDKYIFEWINEDSENAVKDLGHPCLPPNPRRLKGLANLIGRLSSQIPRRKNDSEVEMEAGIFEAKLLMIVAYIYHFHHGLYVRWEANPSLYTRIQEWCKREPREDQILPFLKLLDLPLQSTREEGETVPDKLEDFGTKFPDPTQADIFWIQWLILLIEQDGAGPDHFKRYLHRVPA